MNGPYDDIIDLPHHVSAGRKHMTPTERGAQFSPFAALTGFEDAVRETARQTEGRIELEEDEKIRLNRQMWELIRRLDREPEVTVTLFVPDERKQGGKYEKITGIVKKIDDFQRRMFLKDGSVLPLEDIIQIEIKEMPPSRER